jgi:trigger factor
MDVRISVEESSEVERNIQIEIPRELYNERFFDRLGKAAQGARIKGFRPGKAPKDLVEKMYGERIKTELLGEMLQSAYSDAVTQHELTIVGQPQFDIHPIEEEKDISANALVSLFPEPKIENYFNESFDVEITPFDDQTVEKEIEGILERFADFEAISNREETNGKDFIKIDFEGTIDGEGFPGSSRKDAILELGGEGLPEEFGTALTGAKIGEVKEASLSFPEDHQSKEIAGKTAQYKLTLKEILEKKLPAFDDELAKKTGLGETAEEVRKTVEDRLKQQIEQQNKGMRETRLFEVLIEKNSFEVPQALVDEEIRSILFEFGALDSSKQESYTSDVSHFRESLGASAEKRVRRSVILTQLVKQENIEVSDEDIEQWLDEQVQEMGMERDELNRRIGYPREKERLRKMRARQKMVDLLLEKANISETVKTEESEPAAE